MFDGYRLLILPIDHENGQIVFFFGWSMLESAQDAMLRSQTFRRHPLQRPPRHICPFWLLKSSSWVK